MGGVVVEGFSEEASADPESSVDSGGLVSVGVVSACAVDGKGCQCEFLKLYPRGFLSDEHESGALKLQPCAWSCARLLTTTPKNLSRRSPEQTVGRDVGIRHEAWGLLSVCDDGRLSPQADENDAYGARVYFWGRLRRDFGEVAPSWEPAENVGAALISQYKHLLHSFPLIERVILSGACAWSLGAKNPTSFDFLLLLRVLFVLDLAPQWLIQRQKLSWACSKLSLCVLWWHLSARRSRKSCPKWPLRDRTSRPRSRWTSLSSSLSLGTPRATLARRPCPLWRTRPLRATWPLRR
jgi:hypothetical protein